MGFPSKIPMTIPRKHVLRLTPRPSTAVGWNHANHPAAARGFSAFILGECARAEAGTILALGDALREEFCIEPKQLRRPGERCSGGLMVL